VIELCLAVSMHIGLGDGWNERHPCIRYTENNWTIGAFLNSENTVSAYGSYTLEWDERFLEIGLATGYSGADVAPMIRAGININQNVRAFIVPGYDFINKRGGLVLGVEFSN